MLPRFRLAEVFLKVSQPGDDHANRFPGVEHQSDDRLRLASVQFVQAQRDARAVVVAAEFRTDLTVAEDHFLRHLALRSLFRLVPLQHSQQFDDVSQARESGAVAA